MVDYILKPITKERFIKSLNKIQLLKENDLPSERVKGNDSFIYVNIAKRLIKINIPDIYLVKAKGDYIIIKTNARNYLVHSRLNKIEDKLPSYLFLRIHRSYIINISQIVDIEDNSVLVGKTLIPIGRAKKSELVKKINLL